MPSNFTEAPTEAEVATLFDEDRLIEGIDPFVADSQVWPLLEVALALHAKGRINLLSLVDGAGFEAARAGRFYGVQRFFVRAAPSLETSTAHMIALASALEPLEGERGDRSAGWSAFQGWCAAHPLQAAEAISMAEGRDPQALALLAPALLGLGDASVARRLVGFQLPAVRDPALIALGGIAHDSSERQASVATIEALASASVGDDQLGSRILGALSSIFAKARTRFDTRTLALIEALLASGGNASRGTAARFLHDTALVDDPLLDILLPALLRRASEAPDWVEDIDFSLYSLLNSPFRDRAIDFVTDLVIASDGRITLTRLENFAHRLIELPPEQLDAVLVRWLLSGNVALCRGIAREFQKVDGEPLVRRIDMSAFALTDEQAIALCLKAIGHFDMQPAIAASVLVSALRYIHGSAAQAVGELLFDPLLVNFSGEVGRYLETIEADDAAYPVVAEAQKAARTYISGLPDRSVLKELWPSESHRQAESARHADMMRRAHESSMAASPLMSIVSQSVLLYGDRSISYIYDLENKRHMQEMRLQSHGFSTELARGLALDPLGFEHMLIDMRLRKVAR